jgi:hypothetical protein
MMIHENAHVLARSRANLTEQALQGNLAGVLGIGQNADKLPNRLKRSPIPADISASRSETILGAALDLNLAHKFSP